MRNKKFIILLIVLLSAFSGCTDETDYNDPVYIQTRDNLTDNKWEKTFSDPSSEVHEVWTFESNGYGSCQIIYAYKNGEVEEWTNNFLWVLTLDLVINIDNSRYWEIKKITPEILSVQETWQDPVDVPGQTYRKVLEFKSTS